MGPIDIDKIIRNKLLESNELHAHEMDTAKPFVWSAVQNQIGRKRSLTWIHLAAAVVLLMVGFSFVLYNVQKEHKKEIGLLAGKIDQMQRNHSSQVEQSHSKDTQVDSLRKKLMEVEIRLAGLQQQKPLSQKETIVYRTDTVYLKQVEYITAVSGPGETKEIAVAFPGEQSEQMEIDTVQGMETDAAIYPSYFIQAKNRQSETLKFKFGPFVARKN